MILKYAFPSETKAKELINSLTDKKNNFNQVTVTEFTHGLHCIGFQHEYSFNAETEESVLVKEATTYDVDVFWKVEPPIEWKEFEIEPKNPKHLFA